MITFRTFLQESGLALDNPPCLEKQTWINENRAQYHKSYGKDEGERRVFAKAWKDYNAINRNSTNSGTGKET